jgi:general nucleoside transport system permease protein
MSQAQILKPRKLLSWNSQFVQAPLKYIGIFISALVMFGIILLIAGKDPIIAIRETLVFTLGNSFGFSEVIVRMIPLMMTAVAVALPSRLGLINVGAEGQVYMGAWLATWAALNFTNLPIGLLLPWMLICGMIGGALWGIIPAILRARGLVNETITSLLMNYIAPSIITFFIYGPWRSQGNALYPQTDDFVAAGRLPSFFDTRVHLGLIIGLIILALYWYVMKYSRWGIEIRSIGANPQAARRNGLPLTVYLILIFCIGGAIAGAAGMSEIAGIHGRLRPGFSPGFGYQGFLISWLSNGHPLGILVTSFIVSIILTGGDILQIKMGLPYAVVNILLGITLMVVLFRPNFMKGKKE